MPSLPYPVPNPFPFDVRVSTGSAPLPTTADGYFASVSGIDPKGDPGDPGEGVEGVRDPFRHRRPGLGRRSDLVLTRGHVTTGSALARWAETAASGSAIPIRRETVGVRMRGSDGRPMLAWTFRDAWPLRWTVVRLGDEIRELVIERFEIAYAEVTVERLG